MPERWRVHFEVHGVPDSIIVEGETREEIKAKAQAEIMRRSASSTITGNAWAEKLGPKGDGLR